MTEVTAICECYYSEEKKQNTLTNKILEESQLSVLEEIISSSNIYVVKCINLVSNIIYIKKCYGSFIILALMIIEIIFVIIYFTKNANLINEYIYMISNKFINHLSKQKSNKLQIKPNINNDTQIISLKVENKNQEPPKHKEKKSENCLTNIDQLKGKSKSKRKRNKKRRVNFIVNSNENSQKKIKYNKANNLTQNIVIYNKKNFNIESSRTTINKLITPQQPKESVEYNILFPNTNDININIEEYLEKEYDEMEYDEAIRRDHRKFCDCYYDKLKDNQIIINTFFSYEPLRPKSIKILFLILQVNLYFFINGLFYDEDYISNIYHLEKDTFYTMAERFFDNLIYAALAGIVINFIIEFFFIEEKK